jgi:WhiB family redox-sensing transcriptional regulator
MMDIQIKNQAACRGLTDLFYPVYPRNRESVLKEKQAIRICGTCPVQKECLKWALEHELHGIWGGTTEHARERMRRSQNIKYIGIGARK